MNNCFRAPPMPRQEASADLPQGLVAGGAVSDRLLILLKTIFFISVENGSYLIAS